MTTRLRSCNKILFTKNYQSQIGTKCWCGSDYKITYIFAKDYACRKCKYSITYPNSKSLHNMTTCYVYNEKNSIIGWVNVIDKSNVDYHYTCSIIGSAIDSKPPIIQLMPLPQLINHIRYRAALAKLKNAQKNPKLRQNQI